MIKKGNINNQFQIKFPVFLNVLLLLLQFNSFVFLEWINRRQYPAERFLQSA
jgi:hypothetical protein